MDHRQRGENWGIDKGNRKLPERVHWHEIRAAVLFKLSALLDVYWNGELDSRWLTTAA